MDSAGERFEAIRTALADRSNVLTVKELCQLAGVSRSGYYNWMSSQRARELREERDRAAFEQILEAYRFRGYAKGVRGIHMRLLHMGIRVNVKKIFDFDEAVDLSGLEEGDSVTVTYTGTLDSDDPAPVAISIEKAG